MGLEGNSSLAIILIGLGAVIVIAAAVLFRIWRFYLDNTKNKATHLRRIQRQRNTTTTPNPQHGDLEAGEEAA